MEGTRIFPWYEAFSPTGILPLSIACHAVAASAVEVSDAPIVPTSNIFAGTIPVTLISICFESVLLPEAGLTDTEDIQLTKAFRPNARSTAQDALLRDVQPDMSHESASKGIRLIAVIGLQSHDTIV